MQNQFRLDDLLARDVVPHRFEGVAVVQLICRQLREQGLETAGFPRPEQILIASGGAVSATGRSNEQAVETAAHVLGLMLGNDVPVRLRLSVSHATASGGGYASLAEFSEALSYFERPNPEAIVESFRQRAVTAARREVAPTVQIETPAVRERVSVPAPAAAAPSRVSRVALFAVTFAAVAAAAIWVIGQKVTSAQTETAPVAEANEQVEPKKHTTAKNSNAASAQSQQHSILPVGAPTAEVAAAKESSARSAVERAPELQVVARTLSYGYPESLPLVTFANLSTTNLGLFTSEGDIVVDSVVRSSDRIYSTADPQVTMPVSVYPRLPNEPPGPRANRTLLELTIAADGLVERVRMLSTPRNIHEFMLVSAAKAWRFEPARLDGRPVRFRQTLALTPMP